eukprot:527675-Rhodomonas_salina.2
MQQPLRKTARSTPHGESEARQTNNIHSRKGMHGPQPTAPQIMGTGPDTDAKADTRAQTPVSYTHLTLPTICSV